MAVLRVWLLATLASFGAFMFGFDTGSIGAVTTMHQFNLGPLSAIVQGLLVSIMIFTSAISGIFAGALSDRISRVYTLVTGGAIFSIGSAISAASPVLACLFVGRAIAGIGEGFFISVVAVYCVEISPAKSRGRVTSVVQIGIVLGIAAGYFVTYGSSRMASQLAWRLPFILQAIWSALYAVSCGLALPFSPRWLHMKGRIVEAEAVRAKLHRQKPAGSPSEKADWEILKRGRDRSQKFQWKEIVERDVRKRTFLAIFLQVMQQLSGIDALLFYAPTLFRQAGIQGQTSVFLASGVSGIVNIIGTCCATPFMDRMGRKTALISGGILMGSFQALIGIIYQTGAINGPGKWVVIVSLYLFLLVFCATWAMCVRLYSAEIQPIRTRAAVSSISTAANQGTNTLVALVVPVFLEKTVTGPYWLFMCCLFGTAAVAWFYMPETKNKTLLEIDQAFSEKKGPLALPLDSMPETPGVLSSTTTSIAGVPCLAGESFGAPLERVLTRQSMAIEELPPQEEDIYLAKWHSESTV